MSIDASSIIDAYAAEMVAAGFIHDQREGSNGLKRLTPDQIRHFQDIAARSLAADRTAASGGIYQIVD